MKTRPSLKSLDDWYIAYSPYVDTLHVYRGLVNRKRRNELLDRDYGKFFVIYDSRTLKPLLFEMKSASKVFGNIDNMNKENIIQRVTGYIQDNGNTKEIS